MPVYAVLIACMLLSSPIAVFCREGVKLCLTMIVRDESQTIERCLESVKDIVDCVSICDTGSIDNTPDIIRQFLIDHDIPGEVHHHPWKNFGHNRTLSAIAARETLQAFGMDLENSYLLLLDADAVLQISPEFQKDELSSDSYLFLQSSGQYRYYNTYLVKASKPWVCIGPVHEYWACSSAKTKGQLETLSIFHMGDGGCRGTKYERELGLLLDAVEEEPDDPRHMFYLAQTYHDGGEHEKAITWYQNRIDQGGWIEEVWYSMYKIGVCYDCLGEWDSAFQWYLKAYQYRPSRSEPLEKIARHFCSKGQHDLAYLFATEGAKIPYPKNDLLFVHAPVYNYSFDEVLSISAYYTSHRAEGLAAVRRLIEKPTTPASVKSLAESNLRFYINN